MYNQFLSYKPFLIYILNQIIDIFIFIFLFGALIGSNYFDYASIGILVYYGFFNAYRTGYDWNRERYQIFNSYLYSLPIDRFNIYLGRILSGVLSSLIYFLLVCPIVLFLVNKPLNLVKIIFIFVIVCSLAIFGVLLSLILLNLITDPKNYANIYTLVSIIFLFFSLIFYPIDVFPIKGIDLLVEYMPLSLYSNIFRYFIGVLQNKISIGQIYLYLLALLFWNIVIVILFFTSSIYNAKKSY